MEYLIVLGVIGLGYALQNNKKAEINKKMIDKVPKSQQSSAYNSYTSNRAFNIFQEEQKKANVLLEKSKYPQDTNIITPGPTFPIVYNKVDYQDPTLPVEFNSYQKYDNITIDSTSPKQVPVNLSKNNKILQSQVVNHYEKIVEYHLENKLDLPQVYIDLFAKHLVVRGVP